MSRAFVALDGLRGVAALAVVGCHFPAYFGPFAPTSPLPVDLFFALSGFVLAHAYGERLTSGMPLLEFVRLRLIRLGPLYVLGFVWFSAVLVLQLMTGGERGDPLTYGWAFMFGAVGLPTPAALAPVPTLYPINLPAWSLFFELAINVAFALIAPRLTDRRLLAIVVISAAALVVLGLENGNLNMGHNWPTFWGGLARVCFSFPAGLLAYRLWLRRQPPQIPFWVAGLLLLAVFLTPILEGWRAGFDLLAALVLFPVLIYYAASRPIGRLSGVCKALGSASFAVYMLHYPALVTLDNIAKALSWKLDDFAPWSGLVVLAALLAGSLLVDRIYDTPVRRWLTQRPLKTKSANA